MAIDNSALISRIQNIIGDQSNQFSAIIELEIGQSLLRLTSEEIFYWNTFKSTGLTATDNKITLPANTSRVLYVFDSTNNYNYFGAPAEKFHLHVNEINANSIITKAIPFVIERDSSGNEYIHLAQSSADLTYTVVYTSQIDTLSAQVPDTVYAWLLGDVSYIILGDTEDSDINLINRYRLMADRCRQEEINRSSRKGFSRFNSQPQPTSHQFNLNSNGI